MLASLYNGNVHVWNYESQTLVKSFEVTEVPGEQSGLANQTLYLFYSEGPGDSNIPIS